MATSTSSSGKVSRPSTCSSGMVPTTTALMALQVRAIRRAPMRSMYGPDRNCSSTSGAISAKATSPVIVADPVLVSTNHGMAIIDSRVPLTETASAVR